MGLEELMSLGFDDEMEGVIKVNAKREATKLEKMQASRVNVERERAKLEEAGAEPHVLAYLSMAVISLDEQILQTDDEPGSVGC